MSSDDYQELAALWSASVPADEEEELRRLARRMRRVAPIVLWGELTLAIFLGGMITLAIITNLGPPTVFVGCLILLLLSWSAWKRHSLGSIALLIDERNRLSFIRSTLRAKEAELRRSAIELALVLPGILLTMLLGFTLQLDDGDASDLPAFLFAIATTPRGLLSLGFLTCAMLLLLLSHLRLGRELDHLRHLREAYEAEARLDDSSADGGAQTRLFR